MDPGESVSIKGATPLVRRPIRFALILWAGLSVYIACFVPFTEVFQTARFFVLGPVSLFLFSVLLVGLMLMGHRLMTWFFVPGLLLVLASGIFIQILVSNPEFFLRTGWVIKYVLVVFCLYGLAGFLIAALGWFKYFRRRPSAPSKETSGP